MRLNTCLIKMSSKGIKFETKIEILDKLDKRETVLL